VIARCAWGHRHLSARRPDARFPKQNIVTPSFRCSLVRFKFYAHRAGSNDTSAETLILREQRPYFFDSGVIRWDREAPEERHDVLRSAAEGRVAEASWSLLLAEVDHPDHLERARRPSSLLSQLVTALSAHASRAAGCRKAALYVATLFSYRHGSQACPFMTVQEIKNGCMTAHRTWAVGDLPLTSAHFGHDTDWP
jgi:hypothetical protein